MRRRRGREEKRKDRGKKGRRTRREVGRETGRKGGRERRREGEREVRSYGNELWPARQRALGSRVQQPLRQPCALQMNLSWLLLYIQIKHHSDPKKNTNKQTNLISFTIGSFSVDKFFKVPLS